MSLAAGPPRLPSGLGWDTTEDALQHSPLRGAASSLLLRVCPTELGAASVARTKAYQDLLRSVTNGAAQHRTTSHQLYKTGRRFAGSDGWPRPAAMHQATALTGRRALPPSSGLIDQTNQQCSKPS